MNSNLINKNFRNDCETKYKNSEQWQNFAYRMVDNPFMKSQLHERYNGRCANCGNPLFKDKVVIHHLDYDHECIYSYTISSYKTWSSGRIEKVNYPDCERCKREHPEAFEECISRIRPVHKGCNWEIADTCSRYFGSSKKPMKAELTEEEKQAELDKKNFINTLTGTLQDKLKALSEYRKQHIYKGGNAYENI